MSTTDGGHVNLELEPPKMDLERLLREAEATIQVLLSGPVDAGVASTMIAPALLSKAQGALRESEERYLRIVETASEGILTLDSESRFTFVNRRLVEMAGYPVDELLGSSLFQFLPVEAHTPTAERLERAKRGSAEKNEVWVSRKDGSPFCALIRTSPIKDATGQQIGILAMVTDKTASRNAEEALRRSEEQYRQIVETTSDGIFKLDVSGSIVFGNRRFAEMLGYALNEMLGRNVGDFMGGEAKDQFSKHLRLRLKGVTSTVDTTFRHKSGSEIYVNVAGSLLMDESGEHVGNVAMVRDMTEHRRMQLELMISDRMASVGTLAAGVAHEINNPLAIVISNLDGMIESLSSPTGQEAQQKAMRWVADEIKAPLDDAREAAQTARFIVQDLKMFSRAPIEDVTATVDVNLVMDSSLRMAQNEVRHRAKVLKSYARTPRVHVNEARLGQVFLNLVVNAAQSLPESYTNESEIRVTTLVEDERVVVEVRDTGAGIDPTIMNRIFDPFFTTKAVGIGTGLGLSICHRLVVQMGGTLTVESELGKGTAFRVSLPLALAEASAPHSVAPSMSTVPLRGRILVIDDEELILRTMKRVLGEGHDLEVAIEAKDGLARCAAGEVFDIILCDMMMPEMSGMDFYLELQKILPEQAEKIVFLTGGAFTDRVREFLADPNRTHLGKPFDRPTIQALIQRRLRAALKDQPIRP